jgi:predicted transglutaminase-like cysteine proteinase
MAVRNAAFGIAATVAFTGSAMAQVAHMPASTECAPQSSGRPIQFATNLTGRVEPSAGPHNVSKASAILGGTPSKLDQMRLNQAAGAASNALSEKPIADFARCVDAPKSYAPPPEPFVQDNAILGTLSVAIKHSPFDRDWAAVSGRHISAKVKRALTATGARRSSDEGAKVEAVNRWVNRNVEFGEDRDVYGRADYWAPAAETFRRGIGDCEDFAIAKMELLAALGVTRDKMRLVVARDLVRNADHAVLVVTLADGAVMLDNMTDRLLDARLPNDYRPIMSFSHNAKWVHGYAVQSAPTVRMASVPPVVLPTATLQLSDVLTVTAEPEMPVLSIALLSVPLVLPNGLLSRA